MGVFSFLSLFSARRQPSFAHSEDMNFGAASASAFEDSVDFASHQSRRQSDVRRLRRSGPGSQKWFIALLLVAAYALAAVVMAVLGMIEWTTLLFATGVLCIVTAGFVLVFQTGMHRKSADRRLKIPIIAVSLGMMLWVVYLAPAAQILLTPFTFVAFAYGMYRIPRNASLALAASLLVAYACVIAAHYLQRENLALLRLESMHFAALLLSLPGFVYLTGKASLLHRILNKADKKIRTIEADAERDALLGCYNRRFIVQALEEQKQLADDLNVPLCIAILDLDHFKRVNDEMGHLGGDEVLRVFSRVAQQTVRDEDIFGRYGGEEFLLIFPGTSLLPALNTCERVRAQVETHDWPNDMRCSVTVSVGVTQYVSGESVLEFFSRADTATYLAKEGGRNQVVVQEPVTSSAPNAAGPSSTLQYEDEEIAIMLAEEAGLVGPRRSIG